MLWFLLHMYNKMIDINALHLISLGTNFYIHEM